MSEFEKIIAKAETSMDQGEFRKNMLFKQQGRKQKQMKIARFLRYEKEPMN